jgi:hypothetical protein
MAAIRRAGIYRPAVLAAARRFANARVPGGSMGFYLGACLTMAMSAHMIGEMFCERFPETLARRSAMSLSVLRARLHRDQELPRAAE